MTPTPRDRVGVWPRDVYLYEGQPQNLWLDGAGDLWLTDWLTI